MLLFVLFESDLSPAPITVIETELQLKIDLQTTFIAVFICCNFNLSPYIQISVVIFTDNLFNVQIIFNSYKPLFHFSLH